MVPGKKYILSGGRHLLCFGRHLLSGGRHLIIVSYMKSRKVDILKGWIVTKLQLFILIWAFLCSLAVNHGIIIS